jgi:hypothetical protein
MPLSPTINEVCIHAQGELVTARTVPACGTNSMRHALCHGDRDVCSLCLLQARESRQQMESQIMIIDREIRSYGAFNHSLLLSYPHMDPAVYSGAMQ